MNPTHLHLISTHLPIVGLLFVILINIYSIFKRNRDLGRLTLWFYVLLGTFALLAYSTGDGAEKIMETYPGIGEDIIEPHENIALLFFLGLMIVAGIALTGLYLTKTKANLLRPFLLCLLVIALIASVLAVETGITGGAIRHTETKTGNHGLIKK
jgi:FtsH-binding integral membrane protein